MRVVGISACGSGHIFKSIRTFTRVGSRKISCSHQKHMVSNGGRSRCGLDISPDCILTPVACQSLPLIGTIHLVMECCRLLRRHKAVQVLVQECCGLSCSSYGYSHVYVVMIISSPPSPSQVSHSGCACPQTKAFLRFLKTRIYRGDRVLGPNEGHRCSRSLASFLDQSFHSPAVILRLQTRAIPFTRPKYILIPTHTFGFAHFSTRHSL